MIVARVLVLVVLLVSPWPARAATTAALLGGGRLITYVPHGAAPASARRWRHDAETLASIGFRAVVTVATTPSTAPVCRFFKRHGFRVVLAGVADPLDRAEIRRAAHLRRCVNGYVVGRGGLAAGRYTRTQLDAAMARLRAVTHRPVTTSEPVASYESDASLLALGDWTFALAHGSPQFECGAVSAVYQDLLHRLPADRALLFESGWPSAGWPATTEHHQRAFLACIESRGVAFAYFEAFDDPGATADAAASHWGLLLDDDTPKTWGVYQWQPTLTASRDGGGLRGRVAGAPMHLLRVAVFDREARRLLSPPIRVGRRGGWHVALPDARPLTIYLVASAWEPPADALVRLPVIDRYRVFAQEDLP